MGSSATETAIAALEGQFAHAERSLARLRAAISDVRDAVHPPPRVLPPPAQPHAAEALLFTRAIPRERTVRNMICDALRNHDRPGGLGPMAISALIHVDKQHCNVELAHMAKMGRVTRVSQGMYRVVEVEQEAQQA